MIWCFILKVFPFDVVSVRTTRHLRCFGRYLFVFLFVIPCTHVVDHKRTAALNMNVTGKEFVEPWGKGWRCGKVELLTAGS
jgi:hypothetical protein